MLQCAPDESGHLWRIIQRLETYILYEYLRGNCYAVCSLMQKRSYLWQGVANDLQELMP